jgi:predicted RNA-binding protein Jag
MSKKTIEQPVSGIENIKNEIMAQITGFVEISTDQEGIRLTREIDGKKHAVNVHIHQPGEDGKVLVEIQLLAKPIVNVIKKVEITITAKQNELISTVKRSICYCRILSGIKMEIDSIVKDFEAS